MFNFILDWFKSDEQKLLDASNDTQTIQITKKQPYYIETVGEVIRVYSRSAGLVEETSSEKVVEKVLELYKKYNGKGEA